MLDGTAPDDDPVALARAHGRSAVLALANALNSPDSQAVVQAAVALLNFGFGQRIAIECAGITIECRDSPPDAPHRTNGETAAWTRR